MKTFTLEQLDKMSTERLLNIFKSVRHNAMYETHINDADLKEAEKFYKLLKTILSERGHVKRKKVNKVNKNKKKFFWKRFAKNLLKSITKELKLPKEHPIVIQEFKNKYIELKNNMHYPTYSFCTSWKNAIPVNKKALENYYKYKKENKI